MSNYYYSRKGSKEIVRPSKASDFKYAYRRLCTALLLLIADASFFWTWTGFVHRYNNTGYLLGYGNLSMVAIIYAILYMSVGRGIRAFQIGVERITNIVVSQVLTLMVVDAAEVFISMAIQNRWRYAPKLASLYFIMWIVQSVMLGILVVPMCRIYKALFPPIDLLEIYGRSNGVFEKLNRIDDKYNITEKVYASRFSFAEIVGMIKKHEAVLINDLPSQQKNRILKACFDMDKRIYVVPKISDIIMKSSEDINLVDTPMFMCRNREISFGQRLVKRAMDLALSVLALILASPVMVIAAVAIKREDGGPIFFRQERMTEGGKRFEILKFRSMKAGADSLTPTMADDERITKVGKVIRAWRIDELPQLLNIIKGDMSIVGPRPERVEHVEKYTKMIPEFRFRSKMKGGLTGYAQVYGRYNTSALDKLKLDLFYITNYNIVTDIQIIFETVKILMLKESTEGFHGGELPLGEAKMEDVRREFEMRENRGS